MYNSSGLTPYIIILAAVGAALAFYFYWQWRKLRTEFELATKTSLRNSAIVESSGEGVLELDAAGLIRFANPAAVRMLGYNVEELLGVNYLEFMSASSEQPERRSQRMGYTTDMMRGVGAMLRRKNGRKRPIEYKMVPVRSDTGAGSVIAFRDLSDRARADLMLAGMQYTAQVGAWELMIDNTNLVNITEGVSDRLGLPSDHPISLQRLMRKFHLEDTHKIIQAGRLAIHDGSGFDLELRIAGVHNAWVRCIGKAERVDGQTVRLFGALQDVTERKLAERTLRETRDFFSATLDAMPSLVLHVNHDGRITYCNQSALRPVLIGAEPVVGELIYKVLDHACYDNVRKGITAALAAQAGSALCVLPAEQQGRDVQFNFVPSAHKKNVDSGCFIVAIDVTELKQLEARLWQAEKLQVIGQLTGGVAHDFNNLLGVILGNLQLMERDAGQDAALAKKLSAAMRAALRGGDLTRRLLAFARRQTLEPVVVNLNLQLGNFHDLMQRTLGESVEIKLRLEPDLWHARVDPGQLENAILNLAINARDAMPQGGHLTVQARNTQIPDILALNSSPTDIEPGDYVVISVRDTGEGIPPELIKRVFDPFFTTKESGKGSGLGLSIVQGFAKQSGGTATIESAAGQGTTVSIYLPRSHEKPLTHMDTMAQKKMPRGTETVLVVEDDTDLRATAILNLQQLGYHVLEASNGAAALQILQEHPTVDIVFTDIMMPGGILGTALAQRARQINPRIRVLLTTGYADDAILNGIGSLPTEGLIHKPYRNEDLALKIRGLLDQELRVA